MHLMLFPSPYPTVLEGTRGWSVYFWGEIISEQKDLHDDDL